MKTWFLASQRPSSLLSSGSYAGNSSYSYCNYTESSDEEGNSQSAIVRPRAGEKYPKSESGERIAWRRHSKIRTDVPSASKKPSSQEKYRRNSQKEAKYQKPNKPNKFADERATETLLPHYTAIPNRPLLNIPVVADLDEPSDFVATGFIGNHDEPIFEAWLLRPSDPLPGHSRSWRRARRIFMPLGTEELEAEVEKFNQKTKKRHSKPVWTILRSLSSDQQQHIERLLDMKKAYDMDRRFRWTLVTLKVGRGASFKLYDSLYIEVILKRSIDSSTGRVTIDPPLVSVSYPLPASDANMIEKPPQAPRSRQSITPPNSDEDTISKPFERRRRERFLREWLRRSIASSNSDEDIISRRFEPSRRERFRRSLPPSDSDEVIISRQFEPPPQIGFRQGIITPHARHRQRISPASSSDRRRSFSGSEGIRVVGISSSDEVLKARKEAHHFNLGRTKEEARRREEQKLKREADQHSRKESVVENRDKGKAEKESERSIGLETMNRRILGLESMLKNQEEMLERLTMEESKRRKSDTPLLRAYYGDGLDQRQRSHRRYYDDDSFSEEPNIRERHREYAPRSRSPEQIYINNFQNSAGELPTPANETLIMKPEPRRRTERDFLERPVKPVVRFRERKPSTSQDLSTGVVSSASKNSQSLDLSGPLFGPAGDQYRPPSPMAPGTSMPSLNPTLNNLISQWTTLKLDIPKEKQQQQQQQ